MLLIRGFLGVFEEDRPRDRRERSRRGDQSASMIKAPDITLIYVSVAFLIVYAVLKKALFRPLAAILDERQREEETATRVHTESLQELSKAIAHAEEELSRARQEALREREGLRAQGRSHLDRKLEEARAAASASIEHGSREIEEQAARLAALLRERAGVLARALAEKILGRKFAA